MNPYEEFLKILEEHDLLSGRLRTYPGHTFDGYWSEDRRRIIAAFNAIKELLANGGDSRQ